MNGFISHNVILPDGSQTVPRHVPVAKSGICRSALRYMEETFGPGPHPEITVADLGCQEGGYAYHGKLGCDLSVQAVFMLVSEFRWTHVAGAEWEAE